MAAFGDRGDLALGWTAGLSDRYEIVREHARGGMATVYLARDLKHDRQVALKLLNPELAAGIGAERFLREIQTAAHLNHPHIVPLLDSGVAGGLPYYVMPFVEGESLRERLTAVGPLPVDEALRIAADVAEALAYAHERGVIHRDIKPGNVLLTGGAAVVTDFGIAAALEQAPEDHLTRTGHAIGSCGYMSPEQASGERDLASTTDQYSLACVLYEMLAGCTPFAAPNARAMLTRQLTEEASPPSTFRDEVPPQLDAVVARALRREARDRFPDTAAFQAALDDSVRNAGAVRRALPTIPPPAAWVVLGAAVLLAVSAWLLPGLEISRTASFDGVSVDTTRFALFPFEYGVGADVDLHETTMLEAALSPWSDLHVVPEFQLDDAMRRTGYSELDPTTAALVAVSEGAGRFIMGTVRRLFDESLSIVASLFDSSGGTPVSLGTHEVRLSGSTNVDSAFSEIALHLLWQGDLPDSELLSATDVKSAMDAFRFGMRAVSEWNLSAADSGFSRALAWDDAFAQAYLWRGLVRAWSQDDPALWGLSANQAHLRSDRLDARDSRMAAALVEQADRNFETACPLWRELTRDFRHDFASWYGLAICLESDQAVVPDAASPTGWAFRSSRHGLVEAYREAFRILPSILEAFRADSYASLQEKLKLTQSTVRTGYSTVDSTKYLAYAALDGDTLAYWPRPESEAFAPVPDREQQSRAAAVDRNRRVLRDIAATWAADAPLSSGAREALAVALAAAGDVRSIDTLRVARSLAEEPDVRHRLALQEVWLLTVFGLPRDTLMLRVARSLADSLLDVRPTLDVRSFAGLSALTGRTNLAASTVRSVVDSFSLPGPAEIEGDAGALLVYSAMGGPVDSLQSLGQRFARRLRSGLIGADSLTLRRLRDWYGLPASLAFDSHPVPGREFTSDWLVAAQSAVERGDVDGARRLLMEHGTVTKVNQPYSRTADALFAQAALWARMREPQTAADWLDPTLAVLGQIPSQLRKPEQCAALVRIAALRALLARDLGNASAAATWARAVTILWSDADPHLQPLVAEMNRLAS